MSDSEAMSGPARHPSLLVVGAGDRGTVYSEFVRSHPDLGQVVAVADVNPAARARLADAHQIPTHRRFEHWRAALATDRFADAVVIATQDRIHAEPALAFAGAGWHILLEKPMAPTAAECRAIVEAVERSGVVFAVAHVLRYTPYTQRLVGLVRSGAIGALVGVQRLEPVGWWHFAHSYVRGNWRREDESSSVLLAKCSHDLDWIRYVVGTRCEAVSSFAGRFEFRPERRPDGAADRCVDCGVEPNCPYSASRLYLARTRQGDFGWPVSVIVAEPTEAAVDAALRRGPYGRCVYACDNDVPDHQVVNLQFAGGRCCSFTMSAFTPFVGRRSTIFGTHGWLVGDGQHIEHVDFVSGQRKEIDVEAGTDRHGGGDHALMRAFLTAVANDDPSALLCGPRETLESHLSVFAAERARNDNCVVRLDEM